MKTLTKIKTLGEGWKKIKLSFFHQFILLHLLLHVALIPTILSFAKTLFHYSSFVSSQLAIFLLFWEFPFPKGKK